MGIPIRNLYYLFCYAWAHFPASDAVETGVDDCPDLQNLFAHLLVGAANRLLRRGLDRGYRSFIEETRSPKGKMLLDDTLRAQSLRRGAVVCTFDELTPDVAHNQIIKATARALAGSNGIAPDQRRALGLLVSRLTGVSDQRLETALFRRVQLSRNTSQYLPIIKLCELVHRSLMPDEIGGGSRFADILEDEATMCDVFESFLRNFYGHEQSALKVGSEIMSWSGRSEDPADWLMLPIMKTDITLRGSDRAIVMDAKFYKAPLASNYGAKRIHSGHLYQLFSYLKHAGLRGPAAPVSGALVYAAVDEAFRYRFQLDGHDVQVVAIDLTQPWKSIRSDLLSLLGPVTETRLLVGDVA